MNPGSVFVTVSDKNQEQNIVYYLLISSILLDERGRLSAPQGVVLGEGCPWVENYFGWRCDDSQTIILL